MNLTESLADAKITRIAIIDDDLSETISRTDLEETGDDIKGLLTDVNDLDRAAYLQILNDQGYNPNPNDPDNLAQLLSEKAVRDAAPERLRKAAEEVLEKRCERAERVQRVIQLLLDAGIQGTNIKTYGNPDVPDNIYFDLIIVDYFLVDNETEKTLQLIEHLLNQHAGQELPVQIILMSSHPELEQNFREIRPRIQTSSSRMRILAKPKPELDDYTQLVKWKLTLEQLARDRRYVYAIENFVKQTADTIKQAVDTGYNKLWELDLHAMRVMYEISCSDNSDFIRYVEKCVSHYLLTHLEGARDLRDTLENLRKKFEQEENVGLISNNAEIGDSHAAIQELMSNIVWRGGGLLTVPDKPAESTEEAEKKKARWIQSFLRFGMVLRDDENDLWLNLTQSCDLAQAKADKLCGLSLLFIGGEKIKLTAEQKDSKKLVHMDAPMPGDGSYLITWDLQRIKTIPVSEFADTFSNNWAIMGELRPEQAQSVVARYASQVARVGLQRTIRSWGLQGIVIEAKNLKKAAGNDTIQGFPVTANALRQGKKYVVYFELSTYDKLQSEFKNGINEKHLQLCQGVAVKSGGFLGSEPCLAYCDARPSNARLRELIQNKGNQWLDQERNANKLIIAVWPSI